MLRNISVHVVHPDGTESDQTHSSSDDPGAMIRFITGITDDSPGSDITFTVRSELEPHDPRRR